jgi:hypothetical protein
MDLERRKALAHVMTNVRLRRAFKKLRAGKKSGRVIAISALFASSLLSGCVATNPNGFRLTASLGAEQVQEHTETYTVKPSDKPYICSWVNVESLCGPSILQPTLHK